MIDPTLYPMGLIVVPIVAAALAFATTAVRSRAAWWVALVALVVEAGLAAALAVRVLGRGDRLVHELGGYGRPGSEGFAVGIELVADGLSALVVSLVAVVSLTVLAIMRRSGPRGGPVTAAYLLLTGGLMGVVLTGDVFNMFVFLEIVGLTTYTLVAADSRPESAVAALKYLVIGTTGASMFLVGVGYVFLATGTLNMADLSVVLAGEADLPFVDGPMYGDTLVVAGFGFIAVGLFVKSAIFPLHTWQPDAYAEAPDTVTVFVSALASTAAAYAFARISLTVFTPAFFETTTVAADLVVAAGATSVVAGSVLAVMQDRIKRMLAYSSVSQFGLIVSAVGIAVHPAAQNATIGLAGSARPAAEFAALGVAIHLVGHGLIKGGLFAGVAGIAESHGARTVQEYAALGRRAPVQSVAVAVLALALVGVPPTVGFLGKWYILVGAIGAGIWPVAVVLALSTVLTLTYVARVLERLYFTPVDEADIAVRGRPAMADGGSERDDSDSKGETDTSGGDRDDSSEGDHDGSNEGDHDDSGGDTEAPGAPDDPERPTTLLAEGGLDDRSRSFAILAVVVGAAACAVALGFAGTTFTAALEPFLEGVYGA